MWNEQNDGLLAGRLLRPLVKRPAKRILRAERHGKGTRLFEARQIRLPVKAADPQRTAMILLAINHGLVNADGGRLSVSALELHSAGG